VNLNVNYGLLDENVLVELLDRNTDE